MKDIESIKTALETDEIADALFDYLQFEGSRVMEECGTDSRFKLTRKKERRLNRVIRANLRRQNPRYRLVRRSFIAAAIILSLLVTVSASAIRSTISNYFLERKYESLDFSETKNPDQHTWDIGVSMPTDIPDGYQLTEVMGGDRIMTFVFSSSQKEDIRLNVYEDGTSVRIDSEDADEVSEIVINGLPGFFITKNGETQMFWGKSPACLLEGPNSEKAALIGMAESIVYLPTEGLKYEEETS